MKILYVDAVGTRGVAEKFAACLNKYHGPQHEARAMVSCSFFGTRMPGEPLPPNLWDVRDFGLRDNCLQWADVVHLIQQTSYRSIGRADMIGKKPTFYQRFTTIDKGDWAKRIWQDADWDHMKFVLVAEGWPRTAIARRTHTLLPAPFPIEDEEYQPVPVSERRPVICFTPMNKNPGPPAPKAVSQTATALKGHALDLISRKPWIYCMQRKARSWVGIDEVETNVVHFSAFEFMALGVPCISRFDENTRRTVCEATGADRLPLVNADLASLRVAADEYMAKGPEEMERISIDLRAWMERYMHPRDVMARYLAMYSGG
jgi:hypothetical protein